MNLNSGGQNVIFGNAFDDNSLYFMIATIVQNTGKKWETVGYKILNVYSGECKLLGYETLKRLNLNIKNLIVDNKGVRTVGGVDSIRRYTKLNIEDGTIVGSPSIVLLGKTDENEYIYVYDASREYELIECETPSMFKRRLHHIASMNDIPIANAATTVLGGSGYNTDYKISSLKENTYIQDVILKRPKFVEKLFVFDKEGKPSNKWIVRIVKPGERFGQGYSLVHNKSEDCLVEFYDATQDKDKFPIGQFVTRYYYKTLIEKNNTGLALDTSVDSWYINAKNMEQIRKWLCSVDLRTKKVY
jgi:hypothetical protein